METLIGLFMKTRVCLVKKIRVYSIIPTFSTLPNIHADRILISRFYDRHDVSCSENRTALLWNYFPDTTFNIVKNIRSKITISVQHPDNNNTNDLRTLS